ncbi:MAG: DUF2231 domain-containing protein [Woronichinia naegeliana WA131]|jgi:uncharacterized membrane protein|uniref:DUF2231 domain-containing protein n=1 Tax=Woronichinia naegeliana WA131 TaxID=2824559 RepID=A0A977PY41_9CYAN|nr:MAG: DUF2231 domain-containing protein [Woronichinia naegeliana WA131]
MLPLNDQNLPYPDTLHPIIVHFVIAMVLFAYVCDLVGYFTRNYRLLEVSWWNLVVASVAIFFAVIFGEFEAALAQAYPAAQPVLDWHTINGWSLSALLVALTAWRGVIRVRNPLKVPAAYLGAATLLIFLIALQIYLGCLVDWVFGLHTVPVVQAIREGRLK